MKLLTQLGTMVKSNAIRAVLVSLFVSSGTLYGPPAALAESVIQSVHSSDVSRDDYFHTGAGARYLRRADSDLVVEPLRGKHTLMSKKIGLSRDAIVALREVQPSGDARNDALAKFTSYLIATSGTVPADVVATVKQAGVTDAQIADVALAVASITLTNLFNRINDTALDFPAAD